MYVSDITHPVYDIARGIAMRMAKGNVPCMC